MASLQGTKIKNTYPGLLKTDDNGVVGAAEKRVTDGQGNATNMTIGTGGASFDSGTVDFTGATVSGLPASAAGLESGTGTDSMQSAASLTTVAASATGKCSIALGYNANTNADFYGKQIAIGANTLIGTSGELSIALGGDAISNGQSGIAIGKAACVGTTGGIAIGGGGPFTTGASASGASSIAIGHNAPTASGTCSIAIGNGAVSNTTGAVALGTQVTAAKAETVTVKELETCVAGGGIYLTTPDGLAQPKLTVNNSSELLIGGNPVGGGAAGLESGTGTDSMQSASSLTTTGANASTDCSIALGFNATTPGIRSVAIGRNALSGPAAVSIGPDSDAGDSAVAIGTGACAGSTLTAAAVAIGQSANTGNNNRAVALGSCTNVSAACGLAIGNETTASGANAIHIAGNASFSSFAASGNCSIAIGHAANTAGAESVSLGLLATAPQGCAVAVGKCARACGIFSVALGNTAFANNQAGNIAIGGGACASAVGAEGALAIGYSARSCAPRSIAFGYVATVCNAGSVDGISIGNDASVGASNGSTAVTCGVAVGFQARACANGSVALGSTVVASKVDTVTIKELETCVAGGGITMKSPNGTEYKLTVSDAGALVIT